MKIAIVVSLFNNTVTQGLLDGALARLEALGLNRENISISRVPGAIELPIIAQQYARGGGHQAVICLGAVIRGETSHYDSVCQQVSMGCQQVALQHNIPIIFGVLTTENQEQALDRIGGAHGHKGRDAADAAVQMVTLMRDLKTAEPATIK